MNTDHLAYFAGYIDGDGSFNLQIINRKRSFRNEIRQYIEHICQIAISGKQIDCLEFFKEKFGGSIIKTKKIGNQSNVYFYRLSISKNNFLKDLKGFLIEKPDQCQLALDFKTSDNKKELIHKLKECRRNFPANEKFKEYILEFRKSIVPTISDYKYLSGFVDAECCIIINKQKCKKSFIYKAKLRCGNTRTPVIDWMMRRFGGNVFFYKKSPLKNHSDFIDYHLEGPFLLEVLKNILPFLIHKKPQCLQAIKLLELIQCRKIPNSKDFLDWKKFSDPIKEEIFHTVKQLNKKGS